ncbi:DoxX family protein [Aliikangiella sp. G2MR2-5]|uniref:HvfX family Cu-binding RiPP maturation protein n=1 Tax=Aliikangiella sp. G2MR2-5 TaxID=2788943 RepID=UPI0018AB6C8A|nr:DoxX family protein [Aliikangiella sp. G2MR2-5]
MQKALEYWNKITINLNKIGLWMATLPIRLILAWEFGEAGFSKLNGENWFSHIQNNFPFPFNIIPVEISWFMATWFEILGAFGLILGLFTRFWALSLMILTVVATLGVHWPQEWNSLSELWKGYAISNDGYGNYKLPLLFLIMLLPLLLRSPDKISADYWLAKFISKKASTLN